MTNEKKQLYLDSTVYIKKAKPLLEKNSTQDPPRDYKHSSRYFTKEGEITTIYVETEALITIPENHSLLGKLEKLATKVK